MADNGKIDVDGLPARPAGNLDSIVGVDKATRQAAQFPVTALPMPQGVISTLQRQDREIADIRSAQGSGIAPYATRASLPSPPASGQELAWVTDDANPSNIGTWWWNGSTWAKVPDRVSGLEGRVAFTERNTIELIPHKNLLDKSQIRRGRYVSAASGAIIGSASYRCSGFIPVEPGKTYIASGLDSSMAGGWFSAADDGAFIGLITQVQTSPGVVAPAGAAFMVVNITNSGQDDTTYDQTAQVEAGEIATAYEPYTPVVPRERVDGLVDKLSSNDVLEDYSFNMIDPAAVDFSRRYSTGSKSIINADANPIAMSDWIPVKDGQFYVVSGAGLYSPASPQGGFFAGKGHINAVSNITWAAPPSGPGGMFQVPSGMGITHVVISLLSADHATLDGPVQMERGEVATAYQPYAAAPRIKPELIPGNSPSPTPPGGSFDAAAWYKFTEGDGTADLAGRWPVFRERWLLRDKDLCVVNTGTSLTARSVEHCTEHPDAAFRPPLMHSRNMASILWDRMRWDGQQYRRYDAAGFFAESGSFATASNLPEWDDGPYRHGLTRYASGPASVAFSVPTGAWQFNFIYRTDSMGATGCTVTIAGGNGLMQVQDDSGSWVEANGYTFSMREAAPVARNVVVPNPATGGSSTINIPSKGNTTYQKRLKMRCKGGAVDSRASAKAVTISATTGRFMYWGVEWSPREFMITYINAARGSHNTQAAGPTGLPRFQDNEVWGFEPDLLFFELPIHNDGAAGAGSYAAGIWGRLTENFVFREDYELSLRARAAHFGLAPEIGMFTSSIAWNFGGIGDDGQLKFGEQSGGKMMTALDKFSEAAEWVWHNHPDVVCIHAAKRWVDAGVAIFGDLRTATEGSGRGGATFTNEGSHWNDTGSKIIAKALTPLFEFVR